MITTEPVVTAGWHIVKIVITSSDCIRRNRRPCSTGRLGAGIILTGSVYHASIVKGCLPVTAHAAHLAAHHQLCRCDRGILMKTACMQSKQSLFSISFFFYYLQYKFDIVFNCIMLNNSYCLPRQYFFI